jgi:hypothetical protein
LVGADVREVRFGDFQPLWVKITNGDDFHQARLFHLCGVVFPHIESIAIADDSAANFHPPTHPDASFSPKIFGAPKT